MSRSGPIDFNARCRRQVCLWLLSALILLWSLTPMGTHLPSQTNLIAVQAEMIADQYQSNLFTSPAITIPVQSVHIWPNHANRAAHVGRSISAAACAINVAGDGNAFAGIVWVAD